MKTMRSSSPVHVLAALVLVVGVLLIPSAAKADTLTVAPGCEVHYDSGHVTVDPKGGIDFQSPSASASTQGCYTVSTPWHIDLDGIEDLIPPPCCIDDYLGISW